MAGTKPFVLTIENAPFTNGIGKLNSFALIDAQSGRALVDGEFDEKGKLKALYDSRTGEPIEMDSETGGPESWQDIDDAPYWQDIRARYRDGSETVGQFFQHDLGSEWQDKHDHREELGLGLDEWPTTWKPL